MGMTLLPMVCESNDEPSSEDALAHVVRENDEEPLPHGALTRWFAMERQQFKNDQRSKKAGELEY